jgi:non-specific serine/threonine protein kinase
MNRTAGVVGQHNLPEDLTSLIGREREEREVSGWLSSHRVVSLVGVGGVGKTRLALSVARAAVADFPDGIWLVELGPITDGELIPATVAASVGLAVSPRRPVIETLITSFGSSQVLLVLDNCEHLVQACADRVERLVRACAQLRVVATSREPLGVPGEITWQVDPLPTPDEAVTSPEQLAEFASVRLFVERAQSALPSFALSGANAAAVAQVCWSLDGLPLALELAAANVRFLSPQQLASRLDDRFKLLVRGSRTAPVRQRTLESAVAWSYDLLDPNDRRLFDRLSVFAGGFSIDAVEVVCDLEPENALNGMARLVEQSLVLTSTDDTGDRRYSLLETLRAYGRERLRERGQEPPLRQRLKTV